MKRLNNKGFTLIEILITLALIVAITAVAVGSFVGISNAKKNESWSLVKDQIESAAKQYFTSNAYLYEGLKGTSSGTIPVGMLVEEDYLNAVTDPRDGKAISSCAVVKVTRDNDGKYTSSLDETSLKETGADCKTDHSITVSEPGAPDIDVTTKCSKDGNNGWCRETETITLNIKKKNGTILNKTYCQGNGSCDAEKPLTDDEVEDSENGSNRITKVTVANQTGKTQKFVSYKIDSEVPKGTLSIAKKGTWPSKNVYLDLNASDDVSGIDSYVVGSTNYFDNSNAKPWTKRVNYVFKDVTKYDGSTKSLTGTITDKAGNSLDIDSNNYKLYTDCQDGNREASGNWYNKSGATCSKKCGGGKIDQERNTKDKNSGNSCSQKLTQKADCNTQTCCSKTVDDGKETCGSYSSCNKDNEKSRTCTQNKKSYYDGSKCKATTRTDKTSCSTSAVSCSISEIETDCKSSAGNHILGRLHVKCDHAIKEIKVHYFYEGGSSRVCNGVSSSTAVDDIHGGSWTTGSSAKNAAYFNFRGCSSTKLRYKVIVTTLNGTKKTYEPSDGWYDFNFSSSSSYSNCNPQAGGIWE